MLNNRDGEINHNVSLMRAWSRFPLKRFDRSNVAPTKPPSASRILRTQKPVFSGTHDFELLRARLYEAYIDDAS